MNFIAEARHDDDIHWREKPTPLHNAKAPQKVSGKVRNLPERCCNVGLSAGCAWVYFWSCSAIAILSLENLRPQQHLSPSLKVIQPCCGGEKLQLVAMSKNYLCASRHQGRLNSLALYNVPQGEAIYDHVHEAQEPRVLALFEDANRLLIIIAQHQTTKDGFIGRLLAYRFDIRDSHPQTPPACTEATVPEKDFIKHLSIDNRGYCISAVTQRNTVLVWELGSSLSTASKPFTYRRDMYTSVGTPTPTEDTSSLSTSKMASPPSLSITHPNPKSTTHYVPPPQDSIALVTKANGHS